MSTGAQLVSLQLFEGFEIPHTDGKCWLCQRMDQGGIILLPLL
jgi:hypothetical protein